MGYFLRIGSSMCSLALGSWIVSQAQAQAVDFSEIPSAYGTIPAPIPLSLSELTTPSEPELSSSVSAQSMPTGNSAVSNFPTGDSQPLVTNSGSEGVPTPLPSGYETTLSINTLSITSLGKLSSISPTPNVPKSSSDDNLSATISVSLISSSTVGTISTPFAFIQLFHVQGSASGALLPSQSVIHTDYKALCPDGSCLQDCQNTARVFSFPGTVNNSDPEQGNPPAITLFDICANLANVSALATSLEPDNDNTFSSYFPVTDMKLSIPKVTADLAQCFVDTCEKTRDPKACSDFCSINSLLKQSTTILDVQTGVYGCLHKLCYNDCSLPYANQEVFGVGLIASYITQGLLVLILAVSFILSASRSLWQHFEHRSLSSGGWIFSKLKNSANWMYKQLHRLKKAQKMLLATQNYLSICAVIASYSQNPRHVDALNGFALLSVAVTGFLPATFHLMLLNSHDMASKYDTGLTTLSWLFSSVLFWLLFSNLNGLGSASDTSVNALNALFNLNSCGKSTAMSLCERTAGTDPLGYLTRFLEYQNIPNIRSIWLLWFLSTVVLFAIILLQYMSSRKKLLGEPDDLQRYTQIQSEAETGIISSLDTVVPFTVLTTGSIFFAFALVYQARMLVVYTQMDVIDWHGWTFGQIVALLIWIPPLLDSARSYKKAWEKEKEKEEILDVRQNSLDGIESKKTFRGINKTCTSTIYGDFEVGIMNTSSQSFLQSAHP